MPFSAPRVLLPLAFIPLAAALLVQARWRWAATRRIGGRVAAVTAHPPVTRTLEVGRVLAVLALLALAGAACRIRDTPAPASHAASGEPTAQASPSSARRTPAAGPPRTGALADRLSRALLSIYDLPGGWKRSQDARGDADDTTLCGTSLGTLEQQRVKLAEVDVGFSRGTTAFVVQAVAAYPSGTAQQVLDRLAATVQPCRDLTTRDEEGSLIQWELMPIPFPQLGDQSVAFREYQPVNQVEALVVYIRRGDLVTVLLDIALRASVDRAHTEALARQLDTKLAEVERER